MSRDHAPRYPSPGPGQVGEPFFNQQARERVPAQEDIEIQEHLSREMGPSADQMVHDGQGMPHMDQRMDPRFQPPVHHPQQMQHNFHPMAPAPQGMQARLQAIHPQHAQMSVGNPKGNEGSARKKQKVSRACDECRRKKIKCDAISDAPNHPKCSNCNRTSSVCAFSRQPMKRGPSKGYIKELADRLETMEKKLTSAQSTSPSVNDFAMSQDLTPGQKRTHSMSENLPAQAYTESQLHGPSDGYLSNSIGGWSGPGVSTVEPRRASQPYDARKTHAPTANMNYNTSIQDTTLPGITEEDLTMLDVMAWKEELMEEYLQILHPVIPLLGDTKGKILEMLQLAPSQGIHDGFFIALAMVMSRLSTTPRHPEAPNLDGTGARAALKALLSAEHQAAITNDSADAGKLIVYLQAYILVVMALEMEGPLAHKGDELLKRSAWLGSAMDMAERLKLHQTQDQDTHPEDMIAVLKRRAYLTIVLLDWFHAASTANHPHFQDRATKVLPSDFAVVGEAFYNLMHLSRFMSHLVTVAVLPTPIYDAPEDRISNVLLSGELQAINTNTFQPVLAKYPVVRAAYFHAKVFLARLFLSRHSVADSDLLSPARALCRLLDSDEYTRNPLTHHFVALAVHTQMDLSRFPGSNAVAHDALGELVHAIDVRNILATDNAAGWKPAFSKALQAKLEALEADSAVQANLQHLTEAVAGGSTEGEGTGGGKVEDWSKVLREGYLSGFKG